MPDYTESPAEPYHSETDEADPRDIAAGMAERDLSMAVAALLDAGTHYTDLNEMVERSISAFYRERDAALDAPPTANPPF